jgi:hypothetical protein
MDLCLFMSIVLLNLFNLNNCSSLEKIKLLEEKNIELFNATTPIKTNDVTGKNIILFYFLIKLIKVFNSRSNCGRK